jgi:hypothetical protein
MSDGHLINCSAVLWLRGRSLLVLDLVYRSRMAGSLAPVMYWFIRTTVCSALWSDAEQLPYQAGMQLVRMLLMVQL